MSDAVLPEEFQEALLSIRHASFDSFVQVKEVPAPKNLSPLSAAIAVDCPPDPFQSFSGGNARIVILYDPAGQPGWNGRFRLVVSLKAKIDPDLAGAELIEEVIWSWFHDNLLAAGAGFHDPAGTVTKVQSMSFGDLRPRGVEAEVEVRASWSPNTSDLAPHVSAISKFLGLLAGQTVEMGVV